MVKWINFKYKHKMERVFIINLGIFSFLNNFFPIIFIFLFKSSWMGCV